MAIRETERDVSQYGLDIITKGYQGFNRKYGHGYNLLVGRECFREEPFRSALEELARASNCKLLRARNGATTVYFSEQLKDSEPIDRILGPIVRLEFSR